MDHRDLIAPKGVEEFEASALERLEACRQSLEAILEVADSRTPDNTLRPLNRLFMAMSELHRGISLMRNVHPDEEIRGAAERCEQEVAKFRTELGLHRPLYDAVKACESECRAMSEKVGEESLLDKTGERMLEFLLRDFRRDGVDQEESVREEIRSIHTGLVELSQEFGRNILSDVRTIELGDASELEGLPDDYVQRHQPDEDGKIRISTDYPDYNPFMMYAKSGRHREQLYRAFRSRAHPKNLTVLRSILQRRHRLSSILGYTHWADYVAEDKMIRSAKAIDEFITRVAEAADERSKREYELLLERKRQDEPGATEVCDWEKGYYEELLRVERFDIDSRDLRPYFQYQSVKEGIFGIASELFGVEFRLAADAETWHEDVEALDVLEGSETVGRVYLDMHPRPGKFKHAAMFPLVAGVRGERLPVASLVCNFSNPREANGLALLEHDDVVTFFHEFGHLLHHLFARDHDWIEFAGTGTEWDFVEVPSQLFEEWAWDADVLRRFTAHHETGEPIPADVVDRLRAARDFGQGVQVRQQMYYASLSLRCHDTKPDELDLDALQRDLQNEYSCFRFVEGTHFFASFGHLDGYSALYYTYMWSLVIEKEAMSQFHEKGLMDRETAKRYRDTILAPGGTRDASDLVRDFLGRDYGFDAFREWLDAGLDCVSTEAPRS